MKKILPVFVFSLLLMSAKSQSHATISNTDLQYIKDFFFLNFIKTPVSDAERSNNAQFNYEITNDAIIIYKTEFSKNAGSNTHHWYYLPLNDLRIQNYNSNFNYFKGAHALWFEGKKEKLYHGFGKKFTKTSDAEYLSGWLNVPFKYTSFRDLDKLKSILDNPPQKTSTVTTKPAATVKENYQFKSLLLSSLYGLGTQINNKNEHTVMQAAGYTLKPQIVGKTEPHYYEHKGKRTVILLADDLDTAMMYILKVPMLGIESDDIIKDFENNGIEYAGNNKGKTSETYFFSAPGSAYTFSIEVATDGLFNYVYLFKEIKKKPTKALDVEREFALIKMADIQSFYDAHLSFTLEGKKYLTTERKDMAAFFNKHMYKAENQDDKIAAPFAVVGKTDFSKKSIAFTVKDDHLFIKLNIPMNGTCDYGLKEIPARYAGNMVATGTGATKGYRVTFEYDYSCEGKNYKHLSVFIADPEGVSTNPVKTYLINLPK